jgi:hypothetical protein
VILMRIVEAPVDGSAAQPSRRARANLSNLPANAAALRAPSMSEDSDDTKNQMTVPRHTALIVSLLCSLNQTSILGYEENTG